jgi:hypothetical protein
MLMTENQDLEQLSRLLIAAAQEVAVIQGPILSSYKTGAEMAKFILDCRDGVKQGTIMVAQKRRLWEIFAPTCDWDDVGGDASLANEVFSLLDKIYGEEIRHT